MNKEGLDFLIELEDFIVENIILPNDKILAFEIYNPEIGLKCGNLKITNSDIDASKKCGNAEKEGKVTKRKTEVKAGKISNLKVGKVTKSEPVLSAMKATPKSQVQIQPDFQQDPNDMIATMQSLDSGRKVFSCKICGLQGLQKQNVRRHIILKHMQGLIASVSCSLCQKEFTLKSNLKAHYISAHNMPDNLAKAALNA